MKNVVIGLVVIAVIIGGFLVFRSGGGQLNSSASPTVLTTSTPAVSNPSRNPSPSSGAALFTVSQIASHNTLSSCYSVIRGSVYDLTSYASRHPGGTQRILFICGKDGTSLFEGQHGGMPNPENILTSLKIGVLTR